VTPREHGTEVSDRTSKVRFAALVLLLAGLATGVLVAHLGGWLTEEGLSDFVARGGGWAPALYVVISTLLVAAWAPRGLLSVLAGALFGLWLGSILALAMGTLGALIGYGMARGLGRAYVEQRARRTGGRVLRFIRRRGFWAVLACRVCPLVPSELISAASGASAIPFSHFVGATLLGMAPTSILYAAFGSSLLDPDAAAITWGSGGLFLLLTVITGLGLARLWRRDSK